VCGVEVPAHGIDAPPAVYLGGIGAGGSWAVRTATRRLDAAPGPGGYRAPVADGFTG